MITETKGVKIMWQTEYEGMYEQPIVLAKYHDSVSIEQDGKAICLQENYVEEFIKALRKLVKDNRPE